MRRPVLAVLRGQQRHRQADEPTRWLWRGIGKPARDATSCSATAGSWSPASTPSARATPESSRRYPTYTVADARGRSPMLGQLRRRRGRAAGVPEAAAQPVHVPDGHDASTASSPFTSRRGHRELDHLAQLHDGARQCREDRRSLLRRYIRRMPVVLLREKATGRRRTSSTCTTPPRSAARRPVRLASQGDRDRACQGRSSCGRPAGRSSSSVTSTTAGPRFCPMTWGMLTITPDSVPSFGDSPPHKMGIDWIFAAGPARFTRYDRDYGTRRARLERPPHRLGARAPHPGPAQHLLRTPGPAAGAALP